MTDENPLDVLARLAQRVAKTTEGEGLTLIRFAAIPHPEGGAHHVELALLPDEDWTPKVSDEHDDLLAGIEEATRQAELEARAEKAKQEAMDLSEQLKRPDQGIL